MILKQILLKNKEMPANREGESEDIQADTVKGEFVEEEREIKAQRLIKTEEVKTQHCRDSIVDSSTSEGEFVGALHLSTSSWIESYIVLYRLGRVLRENRRFYVS
ncbi:hypothetical protein Hdeb2414_s0014g00423271 [Helianthus debilis subsp. tardiflorus]